jgi:hypothetical protein
LRSALALARDGRDAEAMALCAAIRAAVPDSGPVLHLIGLLEDRAGRTGRAMAFLRAATAAEPRAAPWQADLAALLRRSGLAVAAACAMERAAVLDPSGRYATQAAGFAAERAKVERLARALEDGAAGRGGLINIYVKMHSRPAWADRCLESLRRLVTGHAAVVVLNDGVGEPFLGRLRARHPEVAFRPSPKLRAGLIATPTDDAAAVRLAEAEADPAFDPAGFWAAEIGRDPNLHCLVIEEDCWFTRPIDMSGFTGADTRGLMALRLFLHDWGPATTGAPVRLAPGSWTGLDADGMAINIPANALFRTDYFAYGFDGLPEWSDEEALVRHGRQFLAVCRARNRDFVLAALEGGALRHSSISSTRIFRDADPAGTLLNPRVYNDVINLAWYRGDLDPMEGFPDDIPLPRLRDLVARHAGPDLVEPLLSWSEKFRRLWNIPS